MRSSSCIYMDNVFGGDVTRQTGAAWPQCPKSICANLGCGIDRVLARVTHSATEAAYAACDAA